MKREISCYDVKIDPEKFINLCKKFMICYKLPNLSASDKLHEILDMLMGMRDRVKFQFVMDKVLDNRKDVLRCTYKMCKRVWKNRIEYRDRKELDDEDCILLIGKPTHEYLQLINEWWEEYYED